MCTKQIYVLLMQRCDDKRESAALILFTEKKMLQHISRSAKCLLQLPRFHRSYDILEFIFIYILFSFFFHDLKPSCFSLKYIYIYILDLANGRYFLFNNLGNNPQMRTENKNTYKV